MIKKVFKGLELNETDNNWTAAGKGMAEGALNGLIFTLTISCALYLIGNSQKSKEEIEKLGE